MVSAVEGFIPFEVLSGERSGGRRALLLADLRHRRLAVLAVMLLSDSTYGYQCLGDDYSIVVYLADPHLIASTSYLEYTYPELGGGLMMVNLHNFYDKVIKGDSRIDQAKHLQRVAKIYIGPNNKVYFQPLSRTVDVQNNSVEAVPRVLSDSAHKALDFSAADFSPLEKEIFNEVSWRYQLPFSALKETDNFRKSFVFNHSVYFEDECYAWEKLNHNQGRFGKNCTGSKPIVNPLEIVREKCDDVRFQHVKADVAVFDSGNDEKKKPKIKQVNPTVYCYSFNGCYFAYGTDVMFFDVQLVPHKNLATSDYMTPSKPRLDQCELDAKWKYEFFAVIGDNCLHRFKSYEAAETNSSIDCSTGNVTVPSRSKLAHINSTHAVLVGKKDNKGGKFFYSCHVVKLPARGSYISVTNESPIGSLPYGSLLQGTNGQTFYFKSHPSSFIEQIRFSHDGCTYRRNITIDENEEEQVVKQINATITTYDEYGLLHKASIMDAVVEDLVVQYTDSHTYIYGPNCSSEFSGTLIVANSAPKPPLDQCDLDAESEYEFFAVIGDNCLHRFESYEAARTNSSIDCSTGNVTVPSRSKLVHINNSHAVLLGKKDNRGGKFYYSCHVVKLPARGSYISVTNESPIGSLPYGSLLQGTNGQTFYFKSHPSSFIEQIRFSHDGCTYRRNITINETEEEQVVKQINATITTYDEYGLLHKASIMDAVVEDLVVQYTDSHTYIYGPNCSSEFRGTLIVANSAPKPPLDQCDLDAESEYEFFAVIGDNCLHRFESYEAARTNSSIDCSTGNVTVPSRSKLAHINSTHAVLLGKKDNRGGKFFYSCHVVKLPARGVSIPVTNKSPISGLPYGSLVQGTHDQTFYFKSDPSSSIDQIKFSYDGCTHSRDVTVNENEKGQVIKQINASASTFAEYGLMRKPSVLDTVVEDLVLQYTSSRTYVFGPNCFTEFNGTLIVATQDMIETTSTTTTTSTSTSTTTTAKSTSTSTTTRTTTVKSNTTDSSGSSGGGRGWPWSSIPKPDVDMDKVADAAGSAVDGAGSAIGAAGSAIGDVGSAIGDAVSGGWSMLKKLALALGIAAILPLIAGAVGLIFLVKCLLKKKNK
ncbi:hypothetical protein QR680_010396 [Steinernema hermaphroditum]|uniref:Uncharacterized protein n=1 Tax=Steinernema hermaphroditum TaxID=289476 RepID=A0AA39MBP6_9BILA|nr:hypothetical protein QR680_010396 [Steinernema hermaphroditum]